MASCSHCGADIPEGVKFCINCGAPAAAPVQQQPQAAQPREEAVVLQGNAPVLTTGSYFWSLLLMSIPVIGLIFLIIWACGGCKNPNRRNLARAMLLWQVITVVLFIVLAVVGYFAYGAEFTAIMESVPLS